MNKELTVKDALANIDMVLANFKGTRAEHSALRESVQVVTRKLQELEVLTQKPELIKES